MNAFTIRSATGAGSLEFFERTPADTRRPVERFKVRLTDQDLSAVGRVYVESAVYSDATAHPAPLFAQMAANWKGWQGAMAWESPEAELILRCTQDRTGHVAITVEMRSGPTEADWAIRSRIMTEAGQLEEIAREAAEFFGTSG